MHTFSKASSKVNQFLIAIQFSAECQTSGPCVNRGNWIGRCRLTFAGAYGSGRVTVPWAASASIVFPSGVTKVEVIKPNEPNPELTGVRLNVAVVFYKPQKHLPISGRQPPYHQSNGVRRWFRQFQISVWISIENILENVFETSVVLFQDRILVDK